MYSTRQAIVSYILLEIPNYDIDRHSRFRWLKFQREIYLKKLIFFSPRLKTYNKTFL